jgi:hypothetical protein
MRLEDVHLAESSVEVGCREPGPHIHIRPQSRSRRRSNRRGCRRRSSGRVGAVAPRREVGFEVWQADLVLTVESSVDRREADDVRFGATACPAGQRHRSPGTSPSADLPYELIGSIREHVAGRIGKLASPKRII